MSSYKTPAWAIVHDTWIYSSCKSAVENAGSVNIPERYKGSPLQQESMASIFQKRKPNASVQIICLAKCNCCLVTCSDRRLSSCQMRFKRPSLKIKHHPKLSHVQLSCRHRSKVPPQMSGTFRAAETFHAPTGRIISVIFHAATTLCKFGTE